MLVVLLININTFSALKCDLLSRIVKWLKPKKYLKNDPSIHFTSLKLHKTLPVYAKATTTKGYSAQAGIRQAKLDLYYRAGLSVSGYAPFKPPVFCVNKAQESILA